MEPKLSNVRGCLLTLSVILGLAAPRLGAQNLVPNPGLEGTGGVNIGVTLLSEGVPDQWRAFAVGGGAAEMEVVPVAEDEIFPGSPATNAVLFRVTAFGADQGFDDDNGRFPVTPGLEHQGEFYVRSANEDGTDQLFNFGFPLFNSGGVYQGIEPGGIGGQTAGAEWQLYTGPTFTPPGTVAEGHISFRCAGDGGEDAILIALPSVTRLGTLEFPTNLVCRRSGLDVELEWANPGPYESLRVMRDDVEIATLDVAASTYLDAGVPDGAHTYQVLATVAGTEDGPSCEVSIFRVPVGTMVNVDLGDEDVSTGLENNVRGDGGDGENEFLVCGPESDLREGRSNYGGEDPTFDFPDGLFYFNVTDPAMKAQSAYRLEATVYDDPNRAGAGLFLQYTNADSTGPDDIPNTFFPLAAPPVRTLGGTGEWVVLTWDLENAGFRGFQQGQADFRIGVTDGGRVCLDRVDLTFFPAPTGLACRRSMDGVALTWVNGGDYDEIVILRNGEEIATLPGDASSFDDADAPDGDNTYQVVATAGGLEGGPGCAITVFNVPPGTRVSVDLGDEDVSTG
ncbi:MAG TPA: hypothetical protein VMT52_12080, partial [Planctomycetota bacterium]|nr:hypothetical protein [Planctomycetota bacterium]